MSTFDNNARELLPFRRFRVHFRDGESGATKSVITLAGRAPVRKPFLGSPVLVFSDQAHGNVHIVAESLVTRVAIEQSDKNGDWHETGEWT